MQDNNIREKCRELATRLYELDGEVYKSVGSSLGRTFTGDREGTETLQLYIHDIAGSVVRPVKQLKGFERVILNAGEEKEVKLVCPIREMAYFDEGRNEFVAEFSIPYEVYVGTSSLREDLWVREV